MDMNGALDRVRVRFDVVVVEGQGSRGTTKHKRLDLVTQTVPGGVGQRPRTCNYGRAPSGVDGHTFDR